MKFSISYLVCLFTGFIAVNSPALGQSFNPKQGARIVLLGNTFVDRMQYYNHFEATLHRSFPGRQLVVRNLGWSADEPALMPRPLNFGDVHTHLAKQKADIVLMGFGMNESFKGAGGIPQYQKDLTTFIKSLQKRKYNKISAPQLVLISPIAHEDVGGYYPKPVEHNQNLALYTEAMRNVALKTGVRFIDLFKPSSAAMIGSAAAPLTINGIHLNDRGYQLASQWMAAQLGLKAVTTGDAETKEIGEVIGMKNQQFFYRWRAVNGEYIYGRRKAPFGIRSFPAEMEKLDKMVENLDKIIWEMSLNPASKGYGKALAIVNEIAPESVDNEGYAHDHRASMNPAVKPYPATTDQFVIQKGYEINLFASEQDFPLEKPVNMVFDARGRLWVALIPSYPHYLPGSPPSDRILILEDTDGDGRADRHTIFADKLYLPLSFEFWNGGVLVSAEPNLLFLKDTDGDDKADVRELVLQGFGTEDSHHALHAFTYGQDGALYWHEGVFLHTQTETPYGPVRGQDGASYRFEPRTGKLSNYVSYHYNNPWGNVFDRWGVHYIGDASDGKNYYATPMTGKITYPTQHSPINMFTMTRVRPTAGIEIVSSRHFPDEAQGNFLVNNNIGFQGIKQHRIVPKGSGFVGEEVENLLQSTDLNFRPVDLKFGPDGALYVVDWFNPLVGHMQHSIRDPRRDKAHGRIWRITYPGRPLVKSPRISEQSVVELLENFKVHEDRLRYRTRTQLRAQSPDEVMPQLEKWIAGLDKNDEQYEHNLLEALWMFQDFDVVQTELLAQLLRAKDPRARAAATRVLLYWQDRIPNALDLMQVQVNDESPRVRLEAVMALSHANSEKATEITLQALNHPTDYYLDYAIKETMKYLKPVWLTNFVKDKTYLAQKPEWISYLLGMNVLKDLNRSSTQEAGRTNIQPVYEVTLKELRSLPKEEAVLLATLTRSDVTSAERKAALASLAAQNNVTPINYLIGAIRKTGKNEALSNLLLTWKKSDLELSKNELISQLVDASVTATKETGYAALLSFDPSVWSRVKQNANEQVALLNSIALLRDSTAKLAFYSTVKMLIDSVGSDSSVRAAAIKVLGNIRPTDQENILFISQFLEPKSPYLAPAVETLSGLRASSFTTSSSTVTDRILVIAQQINEQTRKELWFAPMIALGKKVAKKLPKTDSEKALFILESTGTFEVTITALPSKMLFDKKSITLPAGRPVAIHFSNPDEMPHNLVVIKGGSLEKVGAAADAMALKSDGFEKNFVPSLPEVLYATPLLNPGEKQTLSFTTPSEPGEYEFVCTFPGHWMMMRGTIKVTKTTDI